MSFFYYNRESFYANGPLALFLALESCMGVWPAAHPHKASTGDRQAGRQWAYRALCSYEGGAMPYNGLMGQWPTTCPENSESAPNGLKWHEDSLKMAVFCRFPGKDRTNPYLPRIYGHFATTTTGQPCRCDTMGQGGSPHRHIS